MAFCSKCGRQIPDDVKFCPECGANLKSFKGQYDNYQSINNSRLSPEEKEGDESSFGYALLSCFIPIAGIVLFVVWNKEYPKRAKSCLNGFIASVVLWVVLVCCIFSSASNIAYHKFGSVSESNRVEIDIVLQCLK